MLSTVSPIPGYRQQKQQLFSALGSSKISLISLTTKHRSSQIESSTGVGGVGVDVGVGVVYVYVCVCVYHVQKR